MRALQLAATAITIAACFSLANWRTASAQTDLEQRLRDALRQSTARARSLEDDNARMQAEKAQLEAQMQALRAELTAAKAESEGGARSAELERAYQAAVDEFNQRLQQEREQTLRTIETLEKWKNAYNEAAIIARSKESERAQCESAKLATTKRLDHCVAKNEALYAVGADILDRWGKTDWTDIVAAREPLLGFKRVELENAMQDYQDDLLDNHIESAPSQ